VNVTHVSTWEVQCGIAGYTELLCGALERHGVSCEVIPIDRDHAAYLPKRELRDYFNSLADRLAAVELVHIQHEFGFFSGSYHFRASVANFRRLLKAAQRGGRPVVVTFHTSPFYVDWSRINWTSSDPVMQALLMGAKTWWRAGIGSFINRHPQVRAHVHGRTGRRLLIDSGIRQEQIELIAHGTPSPRPAPSGSRAMVRQRLGLAEDATVIGIFGFLASSKGHADALAALQHLPEDFQLLLIGGPHPGDDRSALGEMMEKLSAKPRLSERVAVTGFLGEADARASLDAVDIMVAPYRDSAQTVSGAFGWALASGKPVIASRIPAFRELVHEAACAELVAPESPGELAVTIERVAGDPELRGRLVSNALAWCEANSWDAVAGRHAELYTELLGGRPRTRSRVATIGRAPTSLTPSSGRPIRVAGVSPETLAVGEPANHRRRVRASAVLRATSLPDGRALTFAIDPNERDDPLAQLLLERGYPGDLPCELALHLLGGRGTFVDVGAHLGSFTLAAAALGSRVIAFEASETNFRLLRTAVAYNDLEARVDVIHGAAAAAPGTVRFRGGGLFGAVEPLARKSNGAPPAKEVPSVRVDHVLSELGVERVDLVKLDVEGYELEVLEGLERTLDDDPYVVFESNGPALGPHGGTVKQLKQALVRRGYALFLIDRATPGQLVPVAPDDVQTEAAADYLAVKGDRPALAPWRIVDPFTDRELVERLRAEGGGEPHRRGYVAAVLQIAPPAITQDPLMRATAVDLRRDQDPEVLRVLDGRCSVAEYGLSAELAAPAGLDVARPGVA
jgi:FkbM family methyltransferase